MEVAASRSGINRDGGFPELKAKKKHKIEEKTVNSAAKEEQTEEDREPDEPNLSWIGKFLTGPHSVKKHREKAHQGKKEYPPPDQHKNQRVPVPDAWL
jgi:hypothetical protein